MLYAAWYLIALGLCVVLLIWRDIRLSGHIGRLDRELFDVRMSMYNKLDCKLFYEWNTTHMKVAAEQGKKIHALASALGYSWVPDGKTEARWEKDMGVPVDEYIKRLREEESFLFKMSHIPPSPHMRRKGDKRKRGRK